MSLKPLLAGILLFVLPAQAQVLPFKTFTSREGLISNQVTAIHRDHRGIVWVGTQFGLNWFDGQQFTRIELPLRTGQLYINKIISDSSGRIWILSFFNGLYKFENNRFTQYLPDTARIESNANTIFDLMEVDGQWLAATDNGLFRFDGKTFFRFDEKDLKKRIQIISLCKPNENYLLAGSPHGIFVYKKRGGQWLYHSLVLAGQHIYKLQAETKIWVAGSRGLQVYKTMENLIKNDSRAIIINEKPVTHFHFYQGEEEAWISSDKLYRYIKGELSSFTSENGLPAIPSFSYTDFEKIHWFASTQGLTRLVNDQTRLHTLSGGGFRGIINTLYKGEDGRIWIGASGGLGYLEQDEYHPIPSGDPGYYGYTGWIKKWRDGFLAGTNRGILEWNKGKISMVSDLHTTAAHVAENSAFMGTTTGRIFRFENGEVVELTSNNYERDYIDVLYFDRKNRLWAGHRGNGIRCYRVINNKLELLHNYSTETGFPDLRVRSVHYDNRQLLYFGTRTNGLFVINLDDPSRVNWVNQAQGLQGTWVKAIDINQNNSILLATNRGLYKMEGRLDEPFMIPVNIHPENPELDVTCLLKDGDDYWAGSQAGLLEFRLPARDPENVPGVYFTGVSIDGVKDSSISLYTHTPGALRLSHNNRVIAFDFAAVYQREAEPILYSYKLEGQDAGWSEPDTRNFVSYNLPPGNYKFTVRARHQTGNWSHSPAIIEFSIARPFWKQGWFIVLNMLLIAGILYAVYRYRLHQVLKLERLRRKISTDLHDDIGSTLSSITILSEMALRDAKTGETRDMMQEIKDSSVLLMEKMDDIVWSINPRNDTLENLLIRVRSFASRLFEAKNIDYSITIDDTVKQVRLSMEARQHIYLVLKEAINNIIKYAECTQARIHIQNKQGILRIVVMDNGKGFILSANRQGNGLINMRHRARLMKAQLEINTEPGQGTRIEWSSKIK